MLNYKTYQETKNSPENVATGQMKVMTKYFAMNF